MLVKDCKAIYLGSTPITKVYNGTEVVWDGASDYLPCNYIYSDGKAYINTGYRPNNDTKLTVRMYASSMRSGNPIALVYDANYKFAIVYGSAGYYCCKNVGGASAAASECGSSSMKDAMIELGNDLTINGITYPKHTSSSSADGKVNIFDIGQMTQPLYLFARNNNGTLGGIGSNANMYYFKIEEGGVLIHDFVPMFRISTNEYGMYDNVTGEFYGNANSSGAFKGQLTE